MKTYSEKFKDPRWQKKRLKIMDRDEFKCCECEESSETLNVHHRYYISGRDPWEYPEWSLRTLCKACHKDTHDLSLPREECADIPREDNFETIMGFIGAGNEFAEGILWDIAAQISMLSRQIGRCPALVEILEMVTSHRQKAESEGRH